MARNEDFFDDDMVDLLRRRRKRNAAARRLRLTLLVGSLCFFAIAATATAIIVSSKKPDREFVKEQRKAIPTEEPTIRPRGDLIVPRTIECDFGKWVESGNLQVRVLYTNSNAHIQGVRGRDADRRNLTIVIVEAKNTHAGKISDWPGWQGKGEIEDEFGNTFQPANGWGVWYAEPIGISNDFPNRIPPTANGAIKAVLYFERVPSTSKRIALTLPFDGMHVKFQGNHD